MNRRDSLRNTITAIGGIALGTDAVVDATGWQGHAHQIRQDVFP